MTTGPYTIQDEINEFYKDYLNDSNNSNTFLSNYYDGDDQTLENIEDFPDVLASNGNAKVSVPCMEREVHTSKKPTTKQSIERRTSSFGVNKIDHNFFLKDFPGDWNAMGNKPIQNTFTNFSLSNRTKNHSWTTDKTATDEGDNDNDVLNADSNSMLNEMKSIYWQYIDKNHVHKSQSFRSSVDRRQKKSSQKKSKHLASSFVNDLNYKSVEENSSNDHVYIPKDVLYNMIDDINSIYQDYLNFFTTTNTEVRKSTFLQDIQSLYPSYVTHHQQNDRNKKSSGTKTKPDKSKKQATITDDIFTLYGDYLSKNEERKKLEKPDDFECYVFRFDAVELGPLGKIVEIIRDDENGIHKALTVPIDDLSDYDEETDEDAENVEKGDKSHENYEKTKNDPAGVGTVTGGKLQEKKTIIPNWFKRLQQKLWWKLMIRFWMFAFQFAGTMMVLCVGALCFSVIEDPVIDKHSIEHAQNDSHSHEKNDLTSGNVEIFWEYMLQTYNGSIPILAETQNKFMDDVQTFFQSVDEMKLKKAYAEEVEDRDFIFTKWFYFMIISSTTIGFGDVVPKTENGKVFYIFFSIVAIPLMMTLLKATGEIITTANKKFFTLVNNCLCKRRKFVSEELLSAISVSMLMMSYIGAGCIFLASTDKMSLLDSLYFWVNTFTTVGFGDIVPSLQTHITFLSILVFYEIFGLTMLASLIDSWLVYLRYRKDQILEKSRKKMLITVSKSKMARRKVF